jgi:O-ureido-D-serine cyclo-ligase
VFAIVSASAATGLDPDEAPLREALEVELGGGAVSVVHWHDPDVHWERFDAALIRSTWDYIDHLDEYLAWADEVEGFTSLLNPASVVRWNTDKRYLADLEAEGVPVVPTEFVASGDPCPTSDATMVANHPSERDPRVRGAAAPASSGRTSPRCTVPVRRR